jgi:hypothetical protein
MQLSALFRLAFAAAPGVDPLTLLHRLSRRPIIQEVRRQALRGRSLVIALRLLVSVRFQVLFHLPSRHSFHISSRYLFTIGRSRCLALPDGPGGFKRDSTCPALLGSVSRRRTRFAYGPFTLCGGPFQILRLRFRLVTPAGNLPPSHETSHDTPAETPAGLHDRGLGCCPFAHRY